MLLEKSKVILSPLQTVDGFKNDFPASQIHDTQDMGNGYLWFQFFEEIFIDEPCRFSVCFEPSGYLHCIQFSPGKSKFEDWADWSEERLFKDSADNDQWLLKVLSTDWQLADCQANDKSAIQKRYNWGTIGSYLSQRSGNSYIEMRFC